MAAPTPVEIVRPDNGIADHLGTMAESAVETLLKAWIVMLLAPVVWQPIGYWHALAACVVVSNLVSQGPTYRLWTRGRP